MPKIRVPIAGTVGKAVRIDPSATAGATLGVNLFDADGNLLTLETLAALIDVTVKELSENVFEEQIVDGTILARVGDPETITSPWVFSDNVTLNAKLNVSVTTVTTTSHTAAAEHVILVDDDTAAATVTVTLPPAATAKTVYHVKKLGTTASVIVDADGTETIDGALTATLNTQYESIMLVSDGSNWHVI